jgi:hypothetical protein
MPGLGFILFILPPAIGMGIGLVCYFVHRLRFMAGYVAGIPLLGAVGGWLGMEAGLSLSRNYMYGLSQSWLSTHALVLAFLAGYALGIGLGAVAGRMAQMLFINRAGSIKGDVK